jgi:exosortase
LVALSDFDSSSALRRLGAGYRLSTRQLSDKYEAARAEKTALNEAKMAVRNRWVWFGGWIFLSSLFFARPLMLFVRLSLSNDDISYVFLIPFISVWILFIERRKAFRDLSFDRELGGGILILSVVTAVASRLMGGVSAVDLRVSGYILSLVLFWMAGFALFYGRAAFKAACFPLVFLFLMVPPPSFLLDRIVYLLQAGSAWITGALFDLFHVPALREGFVFHLARVDIEIAKECSGIRSSMALLILALLATHFTLKSFWKKSLFVACGLFMMILKNGIRIAALTLLAIYVDPDFLYGKLHHRGGIVFFLIGLLLLLPVLLFLQRSERK